MRWDCNFSTLMGCLYSCSDHTRPSRFVTRVWNLTEKPIDLQIRVGSILKKAHRLKPGGSKRLKCKSIYKAYMPSGGRGIHNFYYDETCQPYIWVHDSVGDLARTVKQQYISLEDLRDCSEVRIFRDYERGCILVHKKPRPDFCWADCSCKFFFFFFTSVWDSSVFVSIEKALFFFSFFTYLMGLFLKTSVFLKLEKL